MCRRMSKSPSSKGSDEGDLREAHLKVKDRVLARLEKTEAESSYFIEQSLDSSTQRTKHLGIITAIIGQILELSECMQLLGLSLEGVEGYLMSLEPKYVSARPHSTFGLGHK